MNERIKQLRKALGLSQEEFGRRIGVIKSSISRIESGANNPSEQTLILICKEFNVNYSWLVDGKGDIFINIPDTLIDEIALDYNLDEDATCLIKTFLDLSQEDKKGVCTYVKNFASAINKLNQ